MAVTTNKQRWYLGAAALALGLSACASDGAARTKKLLSQHGTIDAEWQIRDDANKTTFTYVLLRTKSGVHETYEITKVDRQGAVGYEQAGGIDGTGCFLLAYGPTTPWIKGLGPESMEGVTQSGDKSRTRCLEYKDNKGWDYIPSKDRKAAEPPPPPPPAPADPPADGTGEPADSAASDPGAVKSALPE